MKINYNELLDLTNVEIKGDIGKVEEIIEYEEILFEISKSLKKYKKDNKLTQKQLAKLLDFDQVMISKMESGNYNPTFKQLHKISRKLTDSAELFLDVLENIIENINQMYKMTYEITIKEKKYNKKEDNNILYMSDYTYKLEGGCYGTEKCTSSISIAG